jgi:hypothetical protein
MKIRNFLSAILLVLPMVSRWVFPGGLERRFIFNFLGMPVYLINICYVLYIFLWHRENRDANGLRKRIAILITIQFVFSLFGWLLNDYSDRWIVLFCNQSMFIIPLIIMCFPPSAKQIDYLKYLLIPAFFIICLEVILFSLDILHYQGLSGQEYGDIQRINSTIGGATGTGVILFMLGAFIFSQYIKKKIWQYFFLILWGIACFYTVSRGTVICLFLFTIIWLYRELKQQRTVAKIIFIGAFAIVLTILNNLHIFNPIIERQAILEQGDMIYSGRDDRLLVSLNIFQKSPIYGVGQGNIFPNKDIRASEFIPYHKAAPHNYWMLILGEQGVMGLIMFLWIFLFCLKKMDYTNYCSYAVILTMLVLFNTESIFLDDEYILLLFLMIIAPLKILKK